MAAGILLFLSCHFHFFLTFYRLGKWLLSDIKLCEPGSFGKEYRLLFKWFIKRLPIHSKLVSTMALLAIWLSFCKCILILIFDNYNIKIDMLIYREEQFHKGIDLTTAPPMHSVLVVSGTTSHCIITMHHMVMDAWSMGIVLREVLEVYKQIAMQMPVNLPKAPQFSQFLAAIQSSSDSARQSFWEDYLKGYSFTSVFPAAVSYDDSKVSHVILTQEVPLETASLLVNLARLSQVSFNTVIVAAWTYLLSAYSREEDVSCGLTSSGRNLEDIDNLDSMVGLLINTLLVRVRVNPKSSIIDLLHSVQQTNLSIRRFEHTPLTEINRICGIQPSQMAFSTLLVFEDFDYSSYDTELLQTKSAGRSNYPLCILIHRSLENLKLEFVCNAQYCSAERGKQFMDAFTTVLCSLSTISSSEPVSSLPLLSGVRHAELEVQNTTSVELNDACMHHVMGKLCVSGPSRIAVVQELNGVACPTTYEELQSKSDTIATLLLHLNGGDRVGTVAIIMEKSVDMLLSMLAVLKAGGAFMPLDPTHPADRNQYQIDTTGALFVLSQSSQKATIEGLSLGRAKIVWIDKQNASPESKITFPTVLPTDLAYVMHTSGTTGRPKGVLLEHQGFVNCILSFVSLLKVNRESRILASSSITFDISLLELFLPLVCGGCAYITNLYPFYTLY